jgi:TolB-like protein/tetratricopeptide (TPR) repeat protein
MRRSVTAASVAAAGIVAALWITLALRGRHLDRRQFATTTAQADAVPTIAVLPFENIGDTATAYFADGVSDEVRGKLASVPGLRVIATTSSLQYRHTSKTPQQVARELGARYLLTGRVQSEKLANGQSRVRVEPELVRVDERTAPTTRWHQAFDADLSDVFQVQTTIADKVSAALNVALGDPQQQQLTARPTTSLAAYDAYLRGEAATAGMSAADPPSLRRGAAFYARAVSLDSSFAVAWARLAYAHAVLVFNTGPNPADEATAQSALRHVEALAPGRPETQLALAWVALLLHNDYQGSLDAARVGLTSAPNDAELLTVAGFAQRSLGQWDEALPSFVAAEALDPQSAVAATEWGRTLHVLRRLPEAQAAFEHALALAPTNVGTIEDLAMVSLSRGDLSDARLVIHSALATVDSSALAAYFATYYDLYWALDDPEQLRVLQLTPSDFDGDRGLWNLARAEVSWLRGDTTGARHYAAGAERELARQERATPSDDQRHLYHGLALAYLGRTQSAIAEAERAISLRPVTRDAFNGPSIEQVAARIYLIAGEPDRAVDHLEHLLSIPHFLTPAWLAIDPTWAPLRSNARFARLPVSAQRQPQ